MNREILFRGKRIDDGEWIYGDLTQDNNGRTFIEYWIENKIQDIGWVDAETVGQYTGLKDSDRRKIFEGDIINVTNDDGEYDDFHCGLGAVEFFAGMWYVCGAPQNGLDDLSQCYNFEVVGNIYDNPELLEVQ